jgi:DNA-binding SARP family transcriptional activator
VDVVAVHVGLLGGFRLDRGGTAVRDLPRGVQRLVAYLGLAHRPARAAVAGQLWPDVPESQAHGSLRSALWRLHRAAPGLVDTSGTALSLGGGVRVDVRETARWAQRALQPRGNPPEPWPGDREIRGELLPGWYEDWVLLERERLRQLRMHAMEAVAEALARDGRFGEAVQAAHAAILVEPLRESAHRILVRIHRAEGNLVEAVRAYESFRELLAAELGAAPSPRLEALVADLVADLRRPAGGGTVTALHRPPGRAGRLPAAVAGTVLPGP